jgi:hypothetical protein
MINNLKIRFFNKHMVKKLIFVTASTFSFGVLASNLQKLTDGEILNSPHIQSGAACWSFIKNDQFLYSDLTNSIIKVDGKIIKMTVSGPTFNIHSNKTEKLVITILKNGNMEILSDGVKSILKTKNKCGS